MPEQWDDALSAGSVAQLHDMDPESQGRDLDPAFRMWFLDGGTTQRGSLQQVSRAMQCSRLSMFAVCVTGAAFAALQICNVRYRAAMLCACETIGAT